ncbi:MAG: DUF2461 domain-containing protein [Muribaculaceae bacterium]|nr:DUF2461 domain-containing protein [Muribaculaceae bacterium]
MYYVKELYSFLRELKENNNRPWFAAHRARFDELRALWMADLDVMIAHMGQWDSRLRGLTARDCAYRIYRDTRFSPDKTPYKTYFSASVSATGRNSAYAGYYLQMGLPSYIDSGLYGGIWQPAPEVLRKLRHAMVDNIEEFEAIINAPDMVKYFPGWCGEKLRTAPKGWNRNHPQIELLRLKDIGKFHPCSEKFFTDPKWPERAAELFSILKPLNDFLDYSIDE